ncbi:hypothetical protein DL767_011312 [Monosporascus sp. MG133]|nr:hypothetical protein DL767_011312 [Monosporascus sp. MG133]
MRIGTMTAKVVLDKPNYVYYGGGEPVIGHVCLHYEPSKGMPKDAELFGPTRVTLLFYGRAKTKVWQDDNWHRGRVALFSSTSIANDDPIKIAARRTFAVPFIVNFSESVETGPFAAFNPVNQRFDVGPDQLMPPTCRKVTMAFASFVEYWS